MAIIDVRSVQLPVGVHGASVVRDGRVLILVDDRLTGRERRAVVEHELVHVARGGPCLADGMPASWDAVYGREEVRVDREVAARLVPAVELAAWLAGRASIGEATTADDIADEWDVPGWLAVLV